MARHKLPKSKKRSKIVMVKLRPAEERDLQKIGRRCRRAGLPTWTRSAVLREAFVAAVEGRRPTFSSFL